MAGQGDCTARRLRHLIIASQSLAAEESLETLLPRLLDLAQAVTAAQASSILLYDASENLLRFAQARNDVLGEDAMRELRQDMTLPLGEGLAGWIAVHRKPVLVRDVSADKRFCSRVDTHTGFHTHGLIGVPILQGDELVGVIQVLNPKERESFDQNDLDVLEGFAGLAAVAIKRARLLAESAERRRMEAELAAAASIQEFFRPRLPIGASGVVVEASSVPAAFVGGDLYDCLRLPGGDVLVYVADVAGKGLPAALVMTALWSRFRAEAHACQDPAEMLLRLNICMEDLLCASMFVTVVVGVWRAGEKVFEYAVAGHPPPFVLRREAGQACVVSDCRPGCPLGVIPQATYASSRIALEPGDAVLLVSDGILEAREAGGELFGVEGALQAVAGADISNAGRAIAEAAYRHCAGASRDDSTWLLLRRTNG